MNIRVLTHRFRIQSFRTLLLFLALLPAQLVAATETFGRERIRRPAEATDPQVAVGSPKQPVDPGGEADLDIHVRNLSGVTAEDVVITTTLPSEWSLRMFTVEPEHAVTCNEDSLAVRCSLGSRRAGRPRDHPAMAARCRIDPARGSPRHDDGNLVNA